MDFIILKLCLRLVVWGLCTLGVEVVPVQVAQRTLPCLEYFVLGVLDLSRTTAFVFVQLLVDLDLYNLLLGSV